MELSDKAKELRNAYQRAYRRKNPDKLREYNRKYWEKKAASYSPADHARELQAQGYTQREIVEYLNISLGTVNNLLKNNHGN